MNTQDHLAGADAQPRAELRPAMSMFATAADYNAAMDAWLAIEADFEVHCNGEFVASACGPRAEAWAEIQRYAAQYRQDGPVVIYEVTRTPVTDL